MHAAERSFLGAERIVDLHELGDKLVGREFFGAESPGEESAVIAPFFQIDQVGAGDWCFGEDHGFLVSTKLMEPVLECAEADELFALEVFLSEAMLHHLTMQLLHPGSQVVLKLEVGQKLVE